MDSDSFGPLRVTVREPMPHQERGRRGAAKRWGDQRIARLDELDPRVRAAVLALINADAAARAANEKASTVVAVEPVEASLEVRRVSDESQAA